MQALVVAALLSVASPLDEPPPLGGDPYYFELFAQTALVCPNDLGPELYDIVEELRFSPVAPATLDALYADVRARVPVVRVRWDGAKLSLLSSDPIELAVGLTRCVLVEVVNDSYKQHSFFARFEDPGDKSNVAETPAGAERGLMTEIRAGDRSTTSLRLNVAIADTSPFYVLFGLSGQFMVDVPVTVVQPATILGTAQDPQRGNLPARFYALGSDGLYRHGEAFKSNQTVSIKAIVQTGKFYKLPFSYSRVTGKIVLIVPPGRVDLSIERGYEYDLEARTINVAPGSVTNVALASAQFIDMQALGWWSGDTHVHWTENGFSVNEDLDLLDNVMRAEDVNFVSNLTLRQVDELVPPPTGPDFVKPDQAPMGPIAGYTGPEYFVQMGEEYRNGPYYGHLNFLNVTDLVQPISTGNSLDYGCAGEPGFVEALDYPINATAIVQAKAQVPLTTPPSSPLILSSHTAFAGSIAPPGAYVADIILGNMDGLDQCRPQTYYASLNLGYRLPLTMGADHPARLVGQARTYVKVDPGAENYAGWVNGIAAGRTFVTSGPLLFLSVNGAEVGDELQVTAGTPLTIHLEAFSRRPLGHVQIVSLDESMPLYDMFHSETQITVDVPLNADQSRWFVARCSPDPNDFLALNGPDIAHTSAVFVTVDGADIFDTPTAIVWRDACNQRGNNVFNTGAFANTTQATEARDYFFQARDAMQVLIDLH